MDMASPISSVIPSAHGPLLAALVRAGVPLSGRQVAALVEGQVSRSRVNSVLSELAVSGLVLREPHPPSVLLDVRVSDEDGGLRRQRYRHPRPSA